MQVTKSKTRHSAATLFMLLTIAGMLVTLPTFDVASAHAPIWAIPTHCYLMACPNPVGVGQTVAIAMWVDAPLPSAAIGNDIRRINYKLTITKPDGTVLTENWPFISDPTGIQSWQYAPDEVGNYTITFNYPGQTYTWSGTYQNDTYGPDSKTITLTVQQAPLPAPIDSYPMPTAYWTRPIEGQNTYWWSISSNWLGAPYILGGTGVAGGIQPYGPAPNSPHVMWTKPVQFGGVVGAGEWNDLIPGDTFYMGGSYNVRFSNGLIMYGILYYQEPYGNGGGGGDYVAVDLQTGQELWRINATATGTSLVPSFGYLYAYETGNQHGILPNGALIATTTVTNQGTVWRAYDPRTGVLTSMNITNVPTGTADVGPEGEILRYAVANIGTTNPNWRLTEWNSSRAFGGGLGLSPTNWYSGTVNASLASCYDWNVSIGLGPGTWSISQASYNYSIMLLTQGSFGAVGSWTGANVTAVSLNLNSRGQVLWTKFYPAAPGNLTRSIVCWDPQAGVFITEDKENFQHNGFSLKDGSQLWGPTNNPPPEAQSDWGYFRTNTYAAYGRFYFSGYGGICECFDISTGKLLWIYGNGGEGNSTFTGLSTPWNRWPIFVDTIADGKVYLATTEHSPNMPYYKDSLYRCIDAYTGKEIWTLMGMGTGMDAVYDRVADGFFIFLNCYDMQMYCVGKGPSATTVETPLADITQGSGLVIQGTVTDISAGTTQTQQKADFPNGVPAVNEASQTAWMEYVYMQKPKPTNATGVPVSLDVIDSNGNYRHIGDTTSDSSGMFSFHWTPDITGKYTVIATFAGSESYWPSSAESSFAVDAAAPTASPYPVTVLPPTEMYVIGVGAAIIVAIAIGVALIMLMLRKRP